MEQGFIHSYTRILFHRNHLFTHLKSMNKAIVLAILLALSQVTVAQKKRIKIDFITDTLMTHDPVMAFEDGLYHVFSTGLGLQHATSTDRKQWTVHFHPTLSTIPRWAHDSVPKFKNHVWAPDIIKFKGRWWLSYSCSTFGKNTSAIGLASSDKLLTDSIEWHDEGVLVCSKQGRDNWNAIDPNFVLDDNGEPWLAFGSFWDGIQLVQLDSTMHIKKPSNQRTIARRYTNRKENPVEAPFIFKHNGWYYLFVSWDYCCRGMESTYKVVVGRSRNIIGPYLDKTGVNMLQGGGTLVIEGDKHDFEATGHCAVYHFDRQDIFLCHGYSMALDGTSVLIQRTVNWTDDDWPVLSTN